MRMALVQAINDEANEGYVDRSINNNQDYQLTASYEIKHPKTVLEFKQPDFPGNTNYPVFQILRDVSS